nr:heparinase II/III-family protein [Bryobacter sp.]
CYALLDERKKRAFVEQMERLAGLLEVGYPPVRQSSVTSHSSEAMLLRDLVGAGIAIFDEEPRMWRWAAERIFREVIPARNFFYPSHTHHQGHAYGPSRFRWEITNAWILKRLFGRDFYDAAMRQVPYGWLYARLPGGGLLANGDMFAGSPGYVYFLTAAYYGDAVLQGAYEREAKTLRIDPVEQLLFGDPELAGASHEELPLTKYFGFPLSGMIARTQWEDAPVIAEFKVKDYHFNNHQHLDAGAFQIHYRRPLAADSGVYDKYFSEHDGNYYKRTIAHNAVLVYDPAEQFVEGRRVNDGGQRWPANAREQRTIEDILQNGFRTGRVTGRGCGPDARRPEYSYLEGDLKEAYSGKVSSYQRAFAFLRTGEAGRPAVVAVLDRIKAARPEFRKTWLLHAQTEPRNKGNRIVAAHPEAVLVADIVFPEAGACELTAVGGPGKEYVVNGRNYPVQLKNDRRPREENPWRVEVTAGANEDLFLAAFQVLDGGTEPLAVERSASAMVIGVRCGSRWIGFVRGAERQAGEIVFAVPGEGRVKCLLTGLAGGRWRLRPGEGEIKVSEEEGCAYFEAAPGRVVLTPAG